MAVTHGDRDKLGKNATFQNRTRVSLVATAIAVAAEAISSGFHSQRRQRAIEILNTPDSFNVAMATAIATDSTVINAATQNGTVILTDASIEAQQALVTDAQIDNAVSAHFNSFITRLTFG